MKGEDTTHNTILGYGKEVMHDKMSKGSQGQYVKRINKSIMYNMVRK